MAVMIPGLQFKDILKDFHGSYGERRLYEMLKELPDDYYILHSTSWNERRRREMIREKYYVQWGEADFTVFHPKKGLMVIEVKGGDLRLTRKEGFVQINSVTKEEKIIDPLLQAEESKYYFRDQVLKPGFGGRLPFGLCSAVWFTDKNRMDVTGKLPMHYNEDFLLWADDMTTVEQVQQAINRVFKACDLSIDSPSQELTDKVLDLLAPEFGMVKSIRVRALANETMFHVMTREQNRLLDYLEEQQTAAIHGAAGTGKTLMALEKARRLESDGPVLLLCYNSFLKDHIRKELGNKHPNISVYNIDGLRAKLTGGRTDDETDQERIEAISEMLVNWENQKFTFKHIIVDEGQDLHDDHLYYLSEIAEKQEGCFYVFYDRNQDVQRWNRGIRGEDGELSQYPEWLEKMECRLVLSHNCRNTHEIAMTSTRPIDVPEKKVKMNPYMDLRKQPEPKLFVVSDESKIQEYVLALIRKYSNAKYRKDDMVILTMNGDGNSIIDQQGMIPELAAVCTKEKAPNKVLFTTVNKFKGLEADVVICVDVDEKTFSSQESRRRFYVGTSRAKTWLNVVTATPTEKLAQVILKQDEVLKRPQATKALLEHLRMKIGTRKDLESLVESEEE